MRVVIGYSPGVEGLLSGRIEGAERHEVLAYGVDPRASLQWHPASGEYAALAALYPAGWSPDVAIFGSLEYVPVPDGIEAAECLTVGISGDWNVGAQAYQLMGSAFDVLVADRNGCDRLRAAGFESVLYTPIWGFDAALHRRLPDVERDLDIVMAGNFNYNIQRDRSRWLARVARLSDRFRVCLTEGVYGEEYVRLQNRARIVFNRSIRGELNMRAYEAPACGALMFYERDNTEIRDLFRDREECVLYGDDDLEELFEYYLTHEEEQARIAEAGWRRVQSESDAHHTLRLLDLLEAERESLAARARRRFLSLPQAERRYCRAYQWCIQADSALVPRAERELGRAAAGHAPPAEVLNALACATAEIGRRGGPDQAKLHQAINYARRACAARPGYVAAEFNGAQILLALQDQGAALALARTIAMLGAGPVGAEQLRGPYFPRAYDSPFVSELERIWADHPPESEAWAAAMRDLLLWRCLEQSSDLALRSGDAECAAEQARRAVALRPEIGVTRLRLARALRALKRWREAEAEYRRALEDAALSTDIWEELARLLIETGQIDSCLEFLCERERILNGCPALERWRGMLQQLHARACVPVAPPPAAETRLLAHPDWPRDDSWQPLLRAWAAEFEAGDPVRLLLLVESERVEETVAAMEAFAAGTLGRSFDEIADITIFPFDEGRLAEGAAAGGADLWIDLPAGACPLDLGAFPLARLKRDVLVRPHWLRFPAQHRLPS